MNTPLAFLNAHLLDTASGLDGLGGLIVQDGRITALGAVEPPEASRIVDCDGLILCPGLIDTRAFKVDAPSCLKSGITQVLLMPDQSPPLDDPAVIERACRLGGGLVSIHPLAAATRNLEGLELSEIGLSLKAGAVAIATGRTSIADTGVMLRLLQYASGFDAVVVSHAEDPSLSAHTCATEGEFALRMGLPAAPTLSESLIVERDIQLVEATGARLHIAQVTCAASIDAVRRAKHRGVPVTCGVTPAHFLLNELSISDYRTFARLSPPLRHEADRLAVIEGLRDGTIDIIASGHDPRTQEDKRLPYAQAEPGMVGAETLLALCLTLVHNELMSLGALLAKLTSTPAKLFGLNAGRLAIGHPADLVLVDMGAPWRIEAEQLLSSAKNTPFDRMAVQGKVKGVWRCGNLME